MLAPLLVRGSLVVLGLTALAQTALAQTDPPRETWPERVDRIVAVVDADPIFESDLERARALGAAARDDLPADLADDATALGRAAESPDEETTPERQRDRLLRRVIDERLRSHEVERAELPPIDEALVASQLEVIADRFGGRGLLEARLETLDLRLDDLRTLVRRQLRLLAYVDERLAPRVLVDPRDVEAYWDGPLRAEMTARGETLPPLDEVRVAIRTLLSERALTREIDAWTERLRRQAEIRHFDDAASVDERVDPRGLPPVWRLLDGPTGPSDDPASRPPEDEDAASGPENRPQPV